LDLRGRKWQEDGENCLKRRFRIYYSQSIIRALKGRRTRWVGHVARLGDMRNLYKIFVGKPEGKNHLEDLDVGGRVLE
jgi:hypothetical protein